MRPSRQRRAARAALAAVVAGASCAELFGCGPGRPDLVLISIDTLRADRLGCYGAGRNTSPAIDRIAAEGARFEYAYAPTSWTLPSHVTLFTGMSIPAHRVVKTEDRIDPARRSLAQQLAEAGYQTAAFVSAPFLHRAYGFDRGFDLYHNFGTARRVETLPPPIALQRRSHADETAAQVIDAAIEWLAQQPTGGPPLFLFVHLWDPHYDYIPPPPYDRIFDPAYAGKLDVRNYEEQIGIHAGMPLRDFQHLAALYDGEIRWTDSQVARLVEALHRRGRLDQTVLTLVSDHGEEFFEHGRRGHMHTLYEESVRVPWILRYPPRVPPGSVVPELASLEDVAPTLLDLVAVAPLPEATGRSRVAELGGAATPGRPVLLAFEDTIALREAGWKVIRYPDGRALYFDLAADPRELQPVPAAEAAPQALAALDRRLDQDRAHAATLRWGAPSSVELDEPTRERLRELGYLDAETD